MKGATFVVAEERKSAGIRRFVNGDLRQDPKLSLLIFDIPTIICTLSQGISLKPGDVVRVEIDGIGMLENRFAERAS